MYTEAQYWILCTSQRLNYIICVIASYTSRLNTRIGGLCSLTVAMDWTQYGNLSLTSLTLPKNSMDFLYSFFPLLFSSSSSKQSRVGLFFNKIFLRYQVSLQLQQEQYPSVLSFSFGSNNLWVSNRLFFGEKKDNNEWLKIALLRKIWVWFQLQWE